jgi:hypothetical protein
MNKDLWRIFMVLWVVVWVGSYAHAHPVTHGSGNPTSTCTGTLLNSSYIDDTNNQSWGCNDAGWRAGIGYDSPATNSLLCSNINFGNLYTNVDSNIAYFCTASGWVQTATGGGGSIVGTLNFIPKFTSGTAIGNSSMDDGATTASTITSTETITVTAAGAALTQVEQAAPGAPASGSGSIYWDSSFHRLRGYENGNHLFTYSHWGCTTAGCLNIAGSTQVAGLNQETSLAGCSATNGCAVTENGSGVGAMTNLTGTDTAIPTNSGTFTNGHSVLADAQGGIADSGYAPLSVGTANLGFIVFPIGAGGYPAALGTSSTVIEAGGNATGCAGNAFPNCVRFVQFEITAKVLVTHYQIQVGANSTTGNTCEFNSVVHNGCALVAIYDTSGNIVANTQGVASCDATGTISFAPTAAFTLTPGIYFWAFAATDTVCGVNALTNSGAQGMFTQNSSKRIGNSGNGVSNPSTAAAMPSSLGTTAATNVNIPVVVGTPE